MLNTVKFQYESPKDRYSLLIGDILYTAVSVEEGWQVMKNGEYIKTLPSTGEMAQFMLNLACDVVS